MMKRLLVVVSAFFILFSLPMNAAAEEIIISFAPWPPYTMMENGKPSGLDIDIVREICNRLGIKSTFQELPWARALAYMERGKVDALLTPRRTEEREKFMYYPSEPMQTEKAVIMALKGSNVKINKLDDLKDKTVGVVRGYKYTPEFDNYQGMKQVVSDDDVQLVKMFGVKRFLLAVGADEVSIKYLCKQAGIEAEVVYVLSETPSYIAFSKKMGEKGKALADKFGDALRKLKAEGFTEKIQSKYF